MPDLTAIMSIITKRAEAADEASPDETKQQPYPHTFEDTMGINNKWGGIPAKNHKGENLLLFIGIIDILQSYKLAKKVMDNMNRVLALRHIL